MGRLNSGETNRTINIRIGLGRWGGRTGNFDLCGRGLVPQMREPQNLVVILFLHTRCQLHRSAGNPRPRGPRGHRKKKATTARRTKRYRYHKRRTFHSLGSSNASSGDSSSSPTPRSSSPLSPSARNASMRSRSCSISLSCASKERF